MAAPRMVTVKYADPAGPEELLGTSWEIPAGIKDPAAYIRSQHREQQARITAQQEREAREKQVLQDRIAQQKQQADRLPGRVDSLEAENANLRAQLEALQGQIAELDESKLLEINQQTAQLMGRSYDLRKDVQREQEVAQELLARSSEMAEAATAGHVAQETALQVITNHQEILNGQLKSSTELINSLKEQLAQAEAEVAALRVRSVDERETIQAAVDMASKTESVARQVAQGEMQEVQASFASMVSLMFNALGIDESMLALEANNLELQPGKALNLTYPELRQYAQIHQQALSTLANARQRNAELPSQTESV